MADSVTQIIISAKDETLNAFNSVKGNLKLVGTLAASIGVGAFATVVKQAADFADEMGKAAQKVGITTKALSELKYAADLSDVSFDTLQTGLRKLSTNMLDAAEGTKEAQDAFKLIGIQYTDTAGKLRPAQDVIKEIADKFAAMEDGSTKTAIAVKLLGKSGAELIPLLNSGAAGLASMADEANRLGVVIDEKAAAAAEQFNDNLTRLEASFQGFKISAGQSVIPALAQITDAMAEAVKEGGLLEALFVGLGGVAANVLGLDDISQAKDRLTEVNREITEIKGKLSGGQKSTTQQVIGLNQQDITELIQRLKVLGLEAANLQQVINPSSKQDGAVKSTVPRVEDPNSAKAAKKVYDEKLAFFRSYNEDLARIITQFRDATVEQGDPSDALQRQLDNYRALNPELQEYLQHQIDIVKQKELQTNQDNLNSAFDDRELQLLEAQSAAEQQALETRAASASDIYDQLLREEEELNVNLIKSDEKRAQAQLALEHDRALKRIELLGLESDQAQVLIDQETANYEKRIKDLAQNGKGGFADLQKAIEGFGQSSAEAFADFAFGAKGDIKDLVESSLKELAKLAIYKGVTQPLFDAASTYFSNILPSFAVGIDYVPHDMIAQIHKGERIVPAAQNIPNNFSGGSSVSVSVNVDASGSNAQGSTPDAAALGAAIGNVVRQELLRQRRSGGLIPA